MSQELERVYTVNLGKALLSVDTHRAPRAINMIKEFARHHMKTEDVRIEEDLAHQIWSKGVRSPPRKIRIRMNKTDEGYVLISPYTEEKESKDTSKEKKGKSSKEKKGKSSKEKKGKSSKEKKDTPAKEVKNDTPAKEKIDTPAKEKIDTPAKEVKKDTTAKEKKNTLAKDKKDTSSKVAKKKSK